jgi:hypothetical protein
LGAMVVSAVTSHKGILERRARWMEVKAQNSAWRERLRERLTRRGRWEFEYSRICRHKVGEERQQS